MTPTEIRARRKALGLSQVQLAAHLNVARSTVIRWEWNQMEVMHGTILELAFEALAWRLRAAPKSP